MLKGKTAVITGSNGGIGWATVEIFARNHAEIWACARVASEEFEERLQGLAKKYNINVSPVYFDVADNAVVKETVKAIGKASGSLDILVNNAGVSIECLFSMTSEDMMRQTLEVNFLAQVHLAQLISRYMMKQKSGSIINVASVAGMEAEKGGIAYGSSKAAVIFSSQTMALELGPYGVRVNSVSPGFIATNMWKRRNVKVLQKVMSETPLQRQGEPHEVAQAILFLASDMSSFITGQNIVVDGGRKRG